MSKFKFEVRGTYTVEAPDALTAQYFLEGRVGGNGALIDDFEGDVEEVETQVYWFTYNIAIRAESPSDAEEILREYIQSNPDEVADIAGSVILDDGDERAEYVTTRDDL